jgi:hypothetical protein
MVDQRTGQLRVADQRTIQAHAETLEGLSAALDLRHTKLSAGLINPQH